MCRKWQGKYIQWFHFSGSVHELVSSNKRNSEKTKKAEKNRRMTCKNTFKIWNETGYQKINYKPGRLMYTGVLISP